MRRHWAYCALVAQEHRRPTWGVAVNARRRAGCSSRLVPARMKQMRGEAVLEWLESGSGSATAGSGGRGEWIKRELQSHGVAQVLVVVARGRLAGRRSVQTRSRGATSRPARSRGSRGGDRGWRGRGRVWRCTNLARTKARLRAVQVADEADPTGQCRIWATAARVERRGSVGDEIEAGHGVGRRAPRSLQADDDGRAR